MTIYTTDHENKGKIGNCEEPLTEGANIHHKINEGVKVDIYMV